MFRFNCSAVGFFEIHLGARMEFVSTGASPKVLGFEAKDRQILSCPVGVVLPMRCRGPSLSIVEFPDVLQGPCAAENVGDVTLK